MLRDLRTLCGRAPLNAAGFCFFLGKSPAERRVLFQETILLSTRRGCRQVRNKLVRRRLVEVTWACKFRALHLAYGVLLALQDTASCPTLLLSQFDCDGEARVLPPDHRSGGNAELITPSDDLAMALEPIVPCPRRFGATFAPNGTLVVFSSALVVVRARTGDGREQSGRNHKQVTSPALSGEAWMLVGCVACVSSPSPHSVNA